MFYYFVYSIFVLVINSVFAYNTKKRAEKLLENPYQKLPDIIQDNIPKINLNIPDYTLFICIIYSLVFGTNNFYICYNTLLLSLTFRPLFSSLTILPTCMNKPINNQSLFNKLFNSTHDLIFSGHTCVFLFCGKMIGGNMGFIIQYFNPLLLIISRQHYTIDVIVAMLMYNSIYYNYVNISNFMNI